MSGRRTDVLDIRELIRHLQAGESDRQTAEALHLTRRTVGKYRAWAMEHDLLQGTLPTPEELAQLLEQDRATRATPRAPSSVEPYRAVVTDLRQRGVEIATIFQRLRDEHGYRGSYASVHRFVRSLEPPAPDVTIRIERPPGEEAQVDFGYAGLMLDANGQRHRAWAFVMTLSYSRHQYVEFVFDQTVETWLALHQHAFECFGGVPRKVVLDNLKAGIVTACFDDPQVQRAYRDCAEHYGFLIAPCRVRQPQEKGKVENGVHYLERSFLAGCEVAHLTDNNVKVLAWVEQIAGLRIHGTTRWQPLVQFQQVERAALLPLPPTPFELATWKQAKLHRDCHIQFDQAYYSAPFRYVGQTLWVRGDARTVRLYADYTLVATHPRATTPGQRVTNLDHLPAEKADALTLTPARCRDEATQIGPDTLQVVNRLLDEQPLDRLRSVRKLLRLAHTYTPTRLEQACTRALRFETVSYVSVKQILQTGLDAEEAPVAIPAPDWPRFARTSRELLAGGA
jgi:transposase